LFRVTHEIVFKSTNLGTSRQTRLKDGHSTCILLSEIQPYGDITQ